MITRVCALIMRVLSCGGDDSKTQLLRGLKTWLTHSYEVMSAIRSGNSSNGNDSSTTVRALLTPHQQLLVQRFELHPAAGRQVVTVLATPQFMQCLLLKSYFSEDSNITAEASELSSLAAAVVEVLSEYLMNREIMREDMAAWSAVVLPLKAFEWAVEEGIREEREEVEGEMEGERDRGELGG